MTTTHQGDTMTNLLEPAAVSYRQLTYNPESKLFSAEMSEIRGFGRVYNDSADEGFTIIGKTGYAAVLVVEHVEIDADNDIRWWDLKPALAADRRAFAGARIWND
jgi:hypothetical protein